MIQEIITLIIIFATVIYVIKSLIVYFSPAKEKAVNPCSNPICRKKD